jgi:clan AA aspartic protease
VEGTVIGPNNAQSPVRFLVDSGATYSLLPHDVWRAIDLQPKRQQAFTLADGTVVTRQISECRIALPQGEGYTTVILGEPGDEALLGAYTLGGFGLMLNPFDRTLQPMRLMLA